VVAAPAASSRPKCAGTSTSIPSICGLPEQIALRSSSRLLGDAARVAETDPISLYIAFRSPERHDARSVENDWLRAGKRGNVCVYLPKGAFSGMTHKLPKTGPEKLAQGIKGSENARRTTS